MFINDIIGVLLLDYMIGLLYVGVLMNRLYCSVFYIFGLYVVLWMLILVLLVLGWMGLFNGMKIVEFIGLFVLGFLTIFKTVFIGVLGRKNEMYV